MARFELAPPAPEASHSATLSFLCALTSQRVLHPRTFLRGRAAEVLSKTYNWQYGQLGVARDAIQKKPTFQEGESGATGSMRFALGGRNEELTIC